MMNDNITLHNELEGSVKIIDDDLEDDEFTIDLDKVGRLNFLDKFNFNLPNLSNLPNLPNLTNISNLSSISNFSNITNLSNEIGKQLDKYKSIYRSYADDEESRLHMLDSLKSILETKIQLKQFSNDLTEVVHRAVTLPAEDISDFEEDDESIETLIEPEIKKFIESIGINEFLKNFSSNILKQISGKDEEEVLELEEDIDDLQELDPELIKLTHLNPEDFQNEELLRSKLKTIQDLSIDQKLKNKLQTKLMMSNYYKYIDNQLQKENERLSNILDEQKAMMDEEVVITEEDQKPSYYDKLNNILGCSHYQRNCKLECPTCHKWYSCPFCHDSEIKDHKLIRNKVKHILCMHCKTPQVTDTNYCVNCEKELSNYFCRKCVLYDNDPTKDIYHCDKCGICRLGLGLDKDYFHCDECNICLSIDLRDKHKCVTNSTHCNCTICNEYLFTSIEKVVFMKCGHSIHQSCFAELVKHSYKCPLCKKTIINVENQFRLLDQEIQQSPMPDPYDQWKCIISCNDCKGKSNVAYHVLGLKCKYCKSYNTNKLKFKKPNDEEVLSDDNEEVEHIHDFDANIMRLVSTNLQNNFEIDLQQN
ncbi:hypothetical protein KGF54_001667 [Candida jiufengensis]|uniref:uncharacterized protein n=1 Tax=Candida jiufengensis TaxID=497108 RepID=UPI0022256030|nr:uncharacterized protein KGF54_001667 [Candida jiufengensis]KAI5955106.1 hypothetical protein KGF54_001667 [Candida jiufengensis]